MQTHSWTATFEKFTDCGGRPFNPDTKYVVLEHEFQNVAKAAAV